MTIQEARVLKVGDFVMQEYGEKYTFFVIRNDSVSGRILLARSVEGTEKRPPMAYYFSKTLREMAGYKLILRFKS